MRCRGGQHRPDHPEVGDSIGGRRNERQEVRGCHPRRHGEYGERDVVRLDIRMGGLFGLDGLRGAIRSSRGVGSGALGRFLRGPGVLAEDVHDAFRKGWTFLICGELDDPTRRAWGKQFTAAGARYMDEVLRDPGAIPLDSPDLWLALHWTFIRAVLCAGPDLEAVIADLEVS